MRAFRNFRSDLDVLVAASEEERLRLQASNSGCQEAVNDENMPPNIVSPNRSPRTIPFVRTPSGAILVKPKPQVIPSLLLSCIFSSVCAFSSQFCHFGLRDLVLKFARKKTHPWISRILFPREFWKTNFRPLCFVILNIRHVWSVNDFPK